jgi:hypothetical protein
LFQMRQAREADVSDRIDFRKGGFQDSPSARDFTIKKQSSPLL